MRHLRKRSAVRISALEFSAHFTTISAHLTDILDQDIRNDKTEMLFSILAILCSLFIIKAIKDLLQDSDNGCI